MFWVDVYKCLRSHDHNSSLAMEEILKVSYKVKYDQPTLNQTTQANHKNIHAADSGLPLCRETLRDILEVLSLKLIERVRLRVGREGNQHEQRV